MNSVTDYQCARDLAVKSLRECYGERFVEAMGLERLLKIRVAAKERFGYGTTGDYLTPIHPDKMEKDSILQGVVDVGRPFLALRCVVTKPSGKTYETVEIIFRRYLNDMGSYRAIRNLLGSNGKDRFSVIANERLTDADFKNLVLLMDGNTITSPIWEGRTVRLKCVSDNEVGQLGLEPRTSGL